tara:strand:+ start:211 stop:459 length:249 start_codon:yes stop_codon:yes gene_type:complete
MSNKKEFKICPVITKDGIRYVVKEDKRRGEGYVAEGGVNPENDYYYITTIKALASRFRDINSVVKVLDTMFGESYVINDNYL